MNYRIWNPPEDSETKNNHFRSMLTDVKQRQLDPEMVLVFIAGQSQSRPLRAWSGVMERHGMSVQFDMSARYTYDNC